MKALIASAVMIFLSHSVFAAANPDVTILWPTVNGLSIENACATSTEFRSLTPVKVCAGYTTARYAINTNGDIGVTKRLLKAGEEPRIGEFLQEEQMCASYGMHNLAVSREMVKAECAHAVQVGDIQEECHQYNHRVVTADTKFKIEKVTHHGELDRSEYFDYTVPACK